MAATPLVDCVCGTLDICIEQYTGLEVFMRIADPDTDRAKNLTGSTLTSDVKRSHKADDALTSLTVTLEGTDQVETITTRADVGGDLGGTFVDFTNGLTLWRVWFDVDAGSSAPAAGGRTLVEVDITSGATAAAVATALTAILDALTGVSASALSAVVTITLDVDGFVGPATDGTAPTGFTFAVTTDGDHVITLTFTPANIVAIDADGVYDILETPASGFPGCIVEGKVLWNPRITAV